MTKQSTNYAVVLGAMLLAMAFAPAASAGCGKALTSRLSVVPALARTDSAKLVLVGENPDASGISITGLWQSQVVLGGQTIFAAFESFTSDGLEFLNDNSPTLEGNVCFGVWSSITNNTIKVYHPAWNYDASGNLIGTVVIKSVITLGPLGLTFKGTVVVDTYGLDGSVAAPEFQAEVTGKRITGS